MTVKYLRNNKLIELKNVTEVTRSQVGYFILHEGKHIEILLKELMECRIE